MFIDRICIFEFVWGRKKSHFKVIFVRMDANYIWLNKLRCSEVIQSRKIIVITNARFSGKRLSPVILVFCFLFHLPPFRYGSEYLTNDWRPNFSHSFFFSFECIEAWEEKRYNKLLYWMTWPSGHDFVTNFFFHICRIDNRLSVDFLRKEISIELQLNISKFDQSFNLIYSE